MRRSLLAVLVLPLVSAACTAPGVDIALRAQQLDFKGDLGASSGNTVATSTADRLGLEDDPIALSPRVDLVGGPLRVSIDAFQVDYDGTGTADADFTLNGVTINAGTDVDSKLDLGLARAALTFTILPLGIVEFGLGLGLAAADLDAELRDVNDPSNAVSIDEVAPIPFLAARLNAAFGPVSAEILAGYIELDIDDVDARYLDIEALARVRLFDSAVRGHLIAGYRFVALDVTYDDGDDRVRADLELAGPYIGISLGF